MTNEFMATEIQGDKHYRADKGSLSCYIAETKGKGWYWVILDQDTNRRLVSGGPVKELEAAELEGNAALNSEFTKKLQGN